MSVKQYQYCKHCGAKFGIRKTIYRCTKCNSTDISRDTIKNMKTNSRKVN